MSWFAELAGKAENLLNNLDEQTGVALRNHNVIKQKKYEHHEFITHPEPGLQKKRQNQRTMKKIPFETRNSNTIPSKKMPVPSNTVYQDTYSDYLSKSPPKRKSPTKKMQNFNNSRKTFLGEKHNEIILDDFGLTQRRHSLPSETKSSEILIYRLENLEIENAMLKNELIVMNREVSSLLERLRRTEDGEVVVSSVEDLSKTNQKLENAEAENDNINMEKKTLLTQMDELKFQIENLSINEIKKYKDKIKDMEAEAVFLKDKNNELDEMVKQLNNKSVETKTAKEKLENDLRHAQSTINNLNADLERSNAECKRLEKDWETYKLRVKSMLAAKDKELKALQQGMNLSEDTRILVQQIDNLKEEREVLSEGISRVRGECEDMKQYMSTLEARHCAAEKVVVALRDALKDERAARNRAEAQCNATAKELKSIQIETGQTIASLRTALRDKEQELDRVRESMSSSVRTTDTSALNVADYDVIQENIDTEKLYHLTEKLVEKQGKIDTLLAENNMLRIQLEKLESKFKMEIQANRMKNHSVVHFQDGDRLRSRNVQLTESALVKFSRRIDVLIRRNPLIRIFVIIYMIGLHFWVLTVLFTSTPENNISRPIKL